MERLDWEAVSEHERRLTGRLLDALASLKRVRIVGPVTTQQRRGVVSFTVSGMRSEDVCRGLDAYGLALRHGHHCAQPLMLVLGIEGTARASLAPYTTEEDIDQLGAGFARSPGQRDRDGDIPVMRRGKTYFGSLAIKLPNRQKVTVIGERG